MHAVLKSFALITLLLAGTASVRADTTSPQEEKRFYIGALVGANFPTGNLGTHVSPVYGLTLGAKIVPMFGVGFYGTYNGQYSSGSFLGLNTGSSTGHFVLTAQADLYVSVFHFGVNAGAEIHSWSASAGPAALGSSSAGFVFGPELGFDIPLSPLVSIGAEAHYLLTTLQGAQGNIVAAGTVKFWL